MTAERAPLLAALIGATAEAGRVWAPSGFIFRLEFWFGFGWWSNSGSRAPASRKASSQAVCPCRMAMLKAVRPPWYGAARYAPQICASDERLLAASPT